MKHLQRGLAKLVCVLLLFQTGCQKEGISSYEVARIESKSKENPTGPVRLLAAIFQQGDATWFFKLMGSVPDVESVEKDYDKFLQSVQFKKAGDTLKELDRDVIVAGILPKTGTSLDYMHFVGKGF